MCILLLENHSDMLPTFFGDRRRLIHKSCLSRTPSPTTSLSWPCPSRYAAFLEYCFTGIVEGTLKRLGELVGVGVGEEVS